MADAQLDLVTAAKAQVAATLAAAIVTASGRPHSIQQVLDIASDIQFALYPAHGYDIFAEWEKTAVERLNKVHGPV
jgi:hypothetical protein